MDEREDMSRHDLLKENARLREMLQTLVDEANRITPSGKTVGYVYARFWGRAREVLGK